VIRRVLADTVDLVEPTRDLTQAYKYGVPLEMGREGADDEDDKVCSDAKYRKKTSDSGFCISRPGIHKRLRFVKVDIAHVRGVKI